MLIKKQITRLKRPSLQAADLVRNELLRIISNIHLKEFERFPQLHERVTEVGDDVLEQCALPARKMIEDLIDCELAYINTSHPDFIGGMGATLLKDEILREKAAPAPKPVAEGSSGFFSFVFSGSKKSAPVKSRKSGLDEDDSLTGISSIDDYIAAYESTDLSERENLQIALLSKSRFPALVL